MQVRSSNLTDTQIAAIIASTNVDTEARIYELLPTFVKDQDPDEVLKGFFSAVEDEFNRNKSNITEILTIVDPRKVNKSFILEGNPVFFHPEQFVTQATAANSPARVELTGSVGGVAANGFYNKFAIYVWSDADQPSSVGQYRKILSYDGGSQIAYLDEDWTTVPSAQAVFALCWPDRVWLPVEVVASPKSPGGTLFPTQTGTGTDTVTLPGLSYIATVDDYYKGWSIVFLDGPNQGTSRKILSYVAADRQIVMDGNIPVLPDEGDWFKLVPPIENGIGITNNFYKDRWIHFAASAPTDLSYGTFIPKQSRQILRSVFSLDTDPSSHVAFVYDSISGDGREFEFPPHPNSYFGVTNNYVPLIHLAEYLGITLDAEDDEDFQREQIAGAYSFHRLRGTRRAFELIGRSLGLDIEVLETSSNYRHEYDSRHVQGNIGEVVPVIQQGRGADDVPANYRTSEIDTARIPDSDLKIFLSRQASNTARFNGDIVKKIRKKLGPFVPIHIQIIFIGYLQRANERLSVDEYVGFNITDFINENIEMSEDFLGTPVGTVPADVLEYTVYPGESLAIRSAARYSVTGSRYGRRGSKFPGNTRWSVGMTLLTS